MKNLFKIIFFCIVVSLVISNIESTELCIIIICIALIIALIYVINFILEAQKKKEEAEIRKLNAKAREFEIKLEKEYRELENNVLKELGFPQWYNFSFYDEKIIVKSRQALENYDHISFFKDYKENLVEIENIIKEKKRIFDILTKFIENNDYKSHPQYFRIEEIINKILNNAKNYRIQINYITSAGNYLDYECINITQEDIDRLKSNPSLLMGKGEYNKYLKEQQKEILNQKHHEYYEKVNSIIDYANEKKDSLIIKGSQEQLDKLISDLFDRTVNSIKKIKSIDSEEWDSIEKIIDYTQKEIEKIINKNQLILEYYDSYDFKKLKNTCEVMMCSQREFNEYITEKVESISKLFGTRIVRNETIYQDEYNYIRPYKKTITPFTAEVSSAVLSSAENNRLEYVVKHFYPYKTKYPEQIQKLHLLIEELETLREAKQIIENYKADYQKYLCNVPEYVMRNDESGFYSRLGFANIDESVLIVEYKFSYTSGGGKAHRSFTIPMTEENIVELINILESKLTISAFTKEQRALMTKKLRDFIKTRDNFTCCSCGNSTHSEPNLLLEIDHIIPVAKGGYTVENNLQTLCWKCNRLKGSKLYPA